MEHGNWKSMYEAACVGDLDLVRYYVKSGVDIDYVHPEFMSTALVSCILARHADVAIYFLDNGADPEKVSPWDELSPAQAAQQEDLVVVLERLRELR